VEGALGVERPLGKGSVGIARFVETLARLGFGGPLNVERETDNQQERFRDLADGVRLLRALARP
jgi:sugar phosphate isomerase/epimerase